MLMTQCLLLLYVSDIALKYILSPVSVELYCEQTSNSVLTISRFVIHIFTTHYLQSSKSSKSSNKRPKKSKVSVDIVQMAMIFMC